MQSDYVPFHILNHDTQWKLQYLLLEVENEIVMVSNSHPLKVTMFLYISEIIIFRKHFNKWSTAQIQIDITSPHMLWLVKYKLKWLLTVAYALRFTYVFKWHDHGGVLFKSNYHLSFHYYILLLHYNPLDSCALTPMLLISC